MNHEQMIHEHPLMPHTPAHPNDLGAPDPVAKLESLARSLKHEVEQTLLLAGQLRAIRRALEHPSSPISATDAMLASFAAMPDETRNRFLKSLEPIPGVPDDDDSGPVADDLPAERDCQDCHCLSDEIGQDGAYPDLCPACALQAGIEDHRDDLRKDESVR